MYMFLCIYTHIQHTVQYVAHISLEKHLHVLLFVDGVYYVVCMCVRTCTSVYECTCVCVRVCVFVYESACECLCESVYESACV